MKAINKTKDEWGVVWKTHEKELADEVLKLIKDLRENLLRHNPDLQRLLAKINPTNLKKLLKPLNPKQPQVLIIS